MGDPANSLGVAMSLDTILRATKCPYKVRVSQDGMRFFLTGVGANQYGSMDRATALRVYLAYRKAWLS